MRLQSRPKGDRFELRNLNDLEKGNALSLSVWQHFVEDETFLHCVYNGCLT